MNENPHPLQNFLPEPLVRLLVINLAVGIAAAALLLAGFLILNPHGLRDLIFADRAPLTVLSLLLFGFVVTFGSVAMGTAIMALGQSEGGGKRRPDHPVLARLSVSAPPAAPGAQR